MTVNITNCNIESICKSQKVFQYIKKMKTHYLAFILGCLENAPFVLISAEGQMKSANWTHVTVGTMLNISIIAVTFDTVSLIGCASVCTWSTMLEVAPSFYFETDLGRCHCNNATDAVRLEDEHDKPEVTYGILQQDEQTGASLGYKSDCHAYFLDGSINVDAAHLKIQPSRNGPLKKVLCYMNQYEGWTLIQARRGGRDVRFTRNWTDYVNGFGVSNDEYWIGLETLHQLSKRGSRLRTSVGVPYGSRFDKTWSAYSYFTVGDAASNYTLTVSGFDVESDGGDSLSSHNGLPFSAPYGDNGCANACAGGWWYGSGDNCGQANLNRMTDGHDSKQCPIWETYNFTFNTTGQIPWSDMIVTRTLH